MSDKRQKNQLELAFEERSRGEAPVSSGEGTESLTATRRTEGPAGGDRLMEAVCERENCEQALRPVQANKGSAGIDPMSVEQLPVYLREHWPEIREQLFSGTYRPQPVKRVEIPKPDGGMRKLGIPTVTMVDDLASYLRGWHGYYGHCQTPSVLQELERWYRRPDCGRCSGNSGNVAGCDLPSYVVGAWGGPWQLKPPAASMVRGGSPTRWRFPSHCPTRTLLRWVFQDWSAVVRSSTRRTAVYGTRTHGGVTGKAGDRLPMSIR